LSAAKLLLFLIRSLRAVFSAESSLIALTRIGTNLSYLRPYAVSSSFRLTTNESSFDEPYPLACSTANASCAKKPILSFDFFLDPSGVPKNSSNAPSTPDKAVGNRS
jgi:hypothetical protein